MPEGTIVFIVGATIVVIGLLAYIAMSMRRTQMLRARFGPEYDHLARTLGDRTRVEKELDQRQRRVSRLHIRPLEENQLGRYRDSWRSVQTQFVDDPKRAVAEADRLVQDVMNARGYPVGEFEQNAADISVDHPNVVMHYRAAHDVAGRSAAGQASTEDLRQALIHYRALFDDLLETRESTVGRNL
jgi:hypothetical protein